MWSSYEFLCAAIIVGSVITLLVGGRVLYVYQSVLVVLPPDEVDRQRRLAYNRNLPLPWGENFEVRRLWILRLRNPLSQLLLCAVVIQMVQALGLGGFAIAALLRTNDLCGIDPAAAAAAASSGLTSATLAPPASHRQVSAATCTLTTVADQFFDFAALSVVAAFLAIVSIPRCNVSSSHHHASSAASSVRGIDRKSSSSASCSVLCCLPSGRASYAVAWFGALLFAGVWSGVEWSVDAHPNQATSTRYHHALPWCWDQVPVAKSDEAWSAMRLSGVFVMIVAFALFGVLSWRRLRRVVRQYRRSLKSPSADPRASSLASFVKHRAVQRRALHFAVAYAALLCVFVVWRLAPLDGDSSRVLLAIICVVHPASGAITALLWAVCEGVLGEVLRFDGCCCCVAEDAITIDDANEPDQVAAVEARLAAPVLEPLPFTHLVLVANAYATRRADERWLQGGSGSDTDDDEDGRPLPSEVVTAGTNPVP